LECAICEEELNSDEDEFEVLGDWSDDVGYSYLKDDLAYEVACRGCIEGLHMYGNTLVYRDEYGEVRVVFDEHMYFFSAERYENLDGINKVMELLERIMKLYTWKSTDAWRGHYNASNDEVDGWVKAVEGWNDSFTPSKYTERVNEVVEVIKPNIIVFPRSSNLCVVYYDLWVKEERGNLIKQLIVPEGEAFDFSRGVYCRAL